MRRTFFISIILCLFLLFASCSLEIIEAGHAGESGEPGMGNVNHYIVPYVKFSLNDSRTGYVATVARGAGTVSVAIPGTVYTQWGDMPVVEFAGFEDDSDAVTVKEIYLGQSVSVRKGALDRAENLEQVTTAVSDGSQQYWSALPSLKKEGRHFHGWFAGEVEIHEGMPVADGMNRARSVFGELVHHDYSEPGCTQAGNLEYWICGDCGEMFSDAFARDSLSDAVLQPTGHVLPLTKHEATDPTCQRTGNILYWSCDACGLFFADENTNETVSDVVVGKVGHRAGTQTEKNELCHWKECIWCGTEIGKQAHNWGEWVITVPATLHTKGSRYHDCTDCDYRRTVDIPEHDHIPGTVVEKVDATCTSGAYYIERCGNADCQEVVRFEIPEEPATGHSGTLYPFVDSTCLVSGTVQHYHCDICDKDYANESSTEPLTGSLVIEKKEHVWSAVWTVAEDVHYHLCTVCQTTRNGEASHVYDRENTDRRYLKSTATCKEGNTYYRSCICGKAGTETFTSGDKAQHSYVTYKAVDDDSHNLVCQWCETANPASVVAHTFVSDGSVKKCTLCGHTIPASQGGFDINVVDRMPQGRIEVSGHSGTDWTFRFVNMKAQYPPTELEWQVNGVTVRTDIITAGYEDFTFSAAFPMTYTVTCHYRNEYGAWTDSKTVVGGAL